MLRPVQLFVIVCCFGGLYLAAQQNPKPQPPLPPSQATPHSTDSQKNNGEWKDDEGFSHRQGSGPYSSSRESVVDLTPPPDDAQTHPNSHEAVHEAEDAAGLLEGDEIGGVQEMHAWDPHKAAKDVEVGDFYFHRQNYRAALDRYQEALYYQYNNAVATFKVGSSQEKLGNFDEAVEAYQTYLKILPQGPLAREAHEAIARLATKSDSKVEMKENAPGANQAQDPH
jgi:tetratricopeptide (TPR) repeat protein